MQPYRTNAKAITIYKPAPKRSWLKTLYYKFCIWRNKSRRCHYCKVMTNNFFESKHDYYVCNNLDNCLNIMRRKSNIKIGKIKNEIEELSEFVKESKRLIRVKAFPIKRIKGVPTSY